MDLADPTGLAGLRIAFESYNEFEELQNITPKGHPHLAYPTNHYNYTPFDIIYVDDAHKEHIKPDNDAFEGVKSFLQEEFYPATLRLQDYTIGNHVVGSDIYKAQYFAFYSIRAGDTVTIERPKGDYIIRPTASVQFKAGTEIWLEDGFHAQPGSDFHAVIGLENNCDIPDGHPDGMILESGNGIMEDGSPTFASIEKVEAANSPPLFSVLPNPNTGQFVINYTGETTSNTIVRIFSLRGELLFEQHINNQRTEIEGNFTAGIYIVNLSNENNQYTQKMVVH